MFMDRAGNASSSTGVGAKWLVLQRRRRRNGHILLWLRRVLSCPGISIITRTDVHGHAYGRHDVHIFALFDMANHCPRVSDVKRQGWYSVSLSSPTIHLITNLVTEFVAAVLAERLQSINHHRGNAQLPMVALLLMRFSSDSEIWFHSVCRVWLGARRWWLSCPRIKVQLQPGVNSRAETAPPPYPPRNGYHIRS